MRKRLAARRREDVDETAAHRELSALVGALDSLVAGERERLGQLLEADLLAGRDPDRRRPGVPAGGIGSASAAAEAATSPPAAEDVERTGALADEVRRRLEAGAPVHAAARQHRDALVAEEPGGALGGVARVLRPRARADTSGRSSSSCSAASSSGSAGSDTRADAGNASAKARRRSVPRSSRDERMQDRLVHDERPNLAGSAAFMVLRRDPYSAELRRT